MEVWVCPTKRNSSTLIFQVRFPFIFPLILKFFYPTLVKILAIKSWEYQVDDEGHTLMTKKNGFKNVNMTEIDYFIITIGPKTW